MTHKLTTMPFRPESYTYDINNLTRRITRTGPVAIVTPFTGDAFGYDADQLYLAYENHGYEQALRNTTEQVIRGLHAREQTFSKQPLPSARQWNSVKRLDEPISELLQTVAQGDYALIFGGLPIDHYQQLARENRSPQAVLEKEADRMYAQLLKKIARNKRSLNLLDPRVQKSYREKHNTPRTRKKLDKYYKN